MQANNYNYYSQAIIHLNHLSHNLQIIKSLIKKPIKILIPVKCNAYGFGSLEISRFLEQKKIDYLGVAFPFEGLYLRQNKIKLPILIFGELIYKKDFENIITNNLTPTIFTLASLNLLNATAKKHHKICSIHINIDTGMARNSVQYEYAIDFIHKALTMKNIKIEGIYTHLSAADEQKRKFTHSQLKKFDALINLLKAEHIEIPLIHVLNSAGIINYPEFCYTMIRPGIMFYGYFPDNLINKKITLQQGMSLRSKILIIQNVKKNTPISYGHTYYTKNEEKIATIGTGYGDGLNRLLSNNFFVLYQDAKCRIRGRICMDHVLIGINHIKKPKLNDTVTIFGLDNKQEIRLEQLAKQIKTIPYEILCNIGARVSRIYR